MDTEEKIQKAFNDSIGEVLCYLDEAKASFTLKKVIKTALWELCDRKIKPLLEGLGNGNDDDQHNRF